MLTSTNLNSRRPKGSFLLVGRGPYETLTLLYGNNIRLNVTPRQIFMISPHLGIYKKLTLLVSLHLAIWITIVTGILSNPNSRTVLSWLHSLVVCRALFRIKILASATHVERFLFPFFTILFFGRGNIESNRQSIRRRRSNQPTSGLTTHFS